jgi:hypothetical protein
MLVNEFCFSGARSATQGAHPMPRQLTPSAVATIGIDIGKNTFHLVGLDQRGSIVLQLKSSREQLERRLANLPRCLIGMEACSGSHLGDLDVAHCRVIVPCPLRKKMGRTAVCHRVAC